MHEPFGFLECIEDDFLGKQDWDHCRQFYIVVSIFKFVFEKEALSLRRAFLWVLRLHFSVEHWQLDVILEPKWRVLYIFLLEFVFFFLCISPQYAFLYLDRIRSIWSVSVSVAFFKINTYCCGLRICRRHP